MNFDQQTYRQIIGNLLAILLFGVVVLQEAHHLLAHHHEAHLHCTATGNDIHLHDADYLPNTCLICYFNFSPSENLFIGSVLQELVCTPQSQSFLYQNKHYAIAGSTIRLRGPPAFVSFF